MKTASRTFCMLLILAVISACKRESSATPTATTSPTSTPIMICPLCFLEATPEKQPTAPVSLVTIEGQSYLLIEDTKTFDLASTDATEFENCSGLTDISKTSNFGKETSSVVEVGGSVSAGFEEAIKLSIATHYNLQLGTVTKTESSLSLLAPAGHKVTYTVEWYEIWMEGRIIPVANLQAGEKIEVPYRAKTGIFSKVRNPVPEYCAPTPTPLPETITPLPTYTQEPPPTETSTQTAEPTATQTPEPATTP